MVIKCLCPSTMKTCARVFYVHFEDLTQSDFEAKITDAIKIQIASAY
jgi:hypothetical protein